MEYSALTLWHVFDLGLIVGMMVTYIIWVVVGRRSRRRLWRKIDELSNKIKEELTKNEPDKHLPGHT